MRVYKNDRVEQSPVDEEFKIIADFTELVFFVMDPKLDNIEVDRWRRPRKLRLFFQMKVAEESEFLSILRFRFSFLGGELLQ